MPDLFQWEIRRWVREPNPETGVMEAWEKREKCLSVVECPRCPIDVDCWAETDGWTEDNEGRWKHDSYGPAFGECPDCGQVIADWWEGAFALGNPEEDSEPRRYVIDMAAIAAQVEREARR